MGRNRFKESISEGAAEIQRLRARISETVRTRNNSPAEMASWRHATLEFSCNYDRLAFPGGYSGALDRISRADPFTIEAALCFLEVRPYFFRSGYMFKDLMRKLKHTELQPDQAQRLSDVVAGFERYRAERKQVKASHRTGTEGHGDVA